MILTLEVRGPEAAKLGAASRKVFNAAGGTIGRQPDSAWVLQDPYVSSRHALVRFTNGVFYIEDTSTNGVFINATDPENRLERGQPYALKSGDVIFIQPYEIHASIASASQASADPFSFSDPFADAPPAPVSAPSPRFRHGVDRGGELLPDKDFEPLELLAPDPKARPTPSGLRAADLARDSDLAAHYQPPAAVAPAPSRNPAQGGLIPDDYNPLGPDSVVLKPSPPIEPARPAAVPPRRPSRRAPTPVSAPGSHAPMEEPGSPYEHGDLAAVLAGAGLSNVAVTPELARSFGEILRIVVSGVMDVLQARQRIKDEFRMRVTTFKRADNNPLKFSANVEDALHNMLVKRNAAYLAPVEAFDDAFEDIRNHQMAMLAGMRAAFQAMLAEFEPDRLQEAFDRQLKKGGPQLVPAKMRYWELYREKVHDMVRDAEATFRELFGDQFAEAYEEQLERLKAQSRSGKR